MPYSVEQFSATNLANLQALQNLTTQTFASVEKLVELNLATSRSLLVESFGHVQAVLDVKDVKELQALQAGWLKPLTDKSAAYVQNVQTIVADSGAEFTKAVEATTAEAQKTLGEAIEKFARNAPVGSESAFVAFKNTLTAGQGAVESAQASVKKALDAVQSNFATVSAQATDAVKKATKAAKVV